MGVCVCVDPRPVAALDVLLLAGALEEEEEEAVAVVVGGDLVVEVEVEVVDV